MSNLNMAEAFREASGWLASSITGFAIGAGLVSTSFIGLGLVAFPIAGMLLWMALNNFADGLDRPIDKNPGESPHKLSPYRLIP